MCGTKTWRYLIRGEKGKIKFLGWSVEELGISVAEPREGGVHADGVGVGVDIKRRRNMEPGIWREGAGE